jgi:heme-degrading monooxygenase HmoA
VIARLWRGGATPQNADAYFRHVTDRVFPSLENIPGYRGAWLLRRDTEGRVEFLALTLWDSMEAVRRFAGDDPSVAVVEPAARAVLADFDQFVKHYDLVHASGSPMA